MTHAFGTLAFLAVLATLAAVSWLLLRARRRNARHAEAQIRAEHQDAVARLDRAARELAAMSERTRSGRCAQGRNRRGRARRTLDLARHRVNVPCYRATPG